MLFLETDPKIQRVWYSKTIDAPTPRTRDLSVTIAANITNTTKTLRDDASTAVATRPLHARQSQSQSQRQKSTSRDNIKTTSRVKNRSACSRHRTRQAGAVDWIDRVKSMGSIESNRWDRSSGMETAALLRVRVCVVSVCCVFFDTLALSTDRPCQVNRVTILLCREEEVSFLLVRAGEKQKTQQQYYCSTFGMDEGSPKSNNLRRLEGGDPASPEGNARCLRVSLSEIPSCYECGCCPSAVVLVQVFHLTFRRNT